MVAEGGSGSDMERMTIRCCHQGRFGRSFLFSGGLVAKF